ncbi:MAG: 2OG-Fe(II) oxygenase [Gammaproteobacteria bacterium]|nr:2OG-Fe(II) oxygenase [Gammaproteobacteria bacterium]
MQTVIDPLPQPDPSRADSALELELFAAIAQGIATQGYVILPAAVPEAICSSLLNYLTELDTTQFHAAGVGRGTSITRNQLVRRDQICWIEQQHGGSQHWLDWAERLRLYLNQHLFLGLFSFESHFSFYQAGDFYRKHVDAFKGESNRVLSVVVYLNKGWEPGQGGELQLFAPDSDLAMVKVDPGYATLVIFLSEQFPHEVLPTQRDRYAVAGWYRINT